MSLYREKIIQEQSKW